MTEYITGFLHVGAGNYRIYKFSVDSECALYFSGCDAKSIRNRLNSRFSDGLLELIPSGFVS